MLIRKSSHGFDVKLYRNNSPDVTRVKTYGDGSQETIEYPASKDYFVMVDGSVVKRTDNLSTAEGTYTDECEKKEYTPHGPAVIGKHVMIGQIITLEDEFPTNSNTKDEMKSFMDLRSISYSSGDSKDELMVNMKGYNPWIL
jgi:hypothetical protein